MYIYIYTCHCDRMGQNGSEQMAASRVCAKQNGSEQMAARRVGARQNSTPNQQNHRAQKRAQDATATPI